MISIEEAVAFIIEFSSALPTQTLELTDAFGGWLAEEVVSPIDSPPFDKALMDGYAIRAADVTAAATELEVVEEVMAGDVPTIEVSAGRATRIMTGGPLPSGADTVVVMENTTCHENKVVIGEYPVVADRNILRKGICIRRDQVLLSRGDRLTPGRIGLLAEIGKDPVRVTPTPSVSVLATGNELVAPSASIGAGQIRNSNGPMLRAMIEQLGATPIDLGISRDDRTELSGLISNGLQSDILILSGGVSAGDLDLVPSLLRDNGVEQVFHKVKIKPGKPLWFGRRNQTLVFGLPGNPVSSFVCFHLFVRLAIRRLQGQPLTGIDFKTGQMKTESPSKGGRTTLFPARCLADSSTAAQIELLPWLGSADLRTLAEADCLAELPVGKSFSPGDSIRYLEL